MQQEFQAHSVAIQGSGYGWLAYSLKKKMLDIVTTPNQDVLSEAAGIVPLLCIDVWEHGYYLKYQNKRMSFLTNIWKIINWDCVNERLEAAKIA